MVELSMQTIDQHFVKASDAKGHNTSLGNSARKNNT